MRFDISEIAPQFPDFAVAVIVAEGLAIRPERSAALNAFVADIEEGARRIFAGTELSAIPGIAVWRRAYRAFGIKKTSYRSSVERLMKNALAGAALPRINPFVDAYNAVSLQHVLPAGADDLDRTVGDLAFRFSREGDDFRDMGALDDRGEPLVDPPKEGEVVYAELRKGALPPLELAAGRALGDSPGDAARRGDTAGKRRRRCRQSRRAAGPAARRRVRRTPFRDDA